MLHIRTAPAVIAADVAVGAAAAVAAVVDVATTALPICSEFPLRSIEMRQCLGYDVNSSCSQQLWGMTVIVIL